MFARETKAKPVPLNLNGKKGPPFGRSKTKPQHLWILVFGPPPTGKGTRGFNHLLRDVFEHSPAEACRLRPSSLRWSSTAAPTSWRCDISCRRTDRHRLLFAWIQRSLVKRSTEVDWEKRGPGDFPGKKDVRGVVPMRSRPVGRLCSLAKVLRIGCRAQRCRPHRLERPKLGARAGQVCLLRLGAKKPGESIELLTGLRNGSSTSFESEGHRVQVASAHMSHSGKQLKPGCTVLCASGVIIPRRSGRESHRNHAIWKGPDFEATGAIPFGWVRILRQHLQADARPTADQRVCDVPEVEKGCG